MVFRLGTGRSKFREKAYLRMLPLLDHTASLFHETDLRNTYVIAAQHVVSTTYSLFDKLIELGLNPEHLAVIGKCYSTDPQAVQELEKLGIDVCPSSMCFQSHQSFDDEYRNNIKQFLKNRLDKLRNPTINKIIVLDDGAELIAAVNSIGVSDKVVAIEQTSSGYHKLKRKQIHFPIINVARSEAKLNFESPIIAKLVIDSFMLQLPKFSHNIRNVLVIGNGPIGSQIVDVLRQHKYHVDTFDRVQSKSTINNRIQLDTSLARYDLIIGCTGKTVLSVHQLAKLKKGVILVSASSSDREFNASFLRKLVAPIYNCHDTICVDNKWLVNCGFPINFSSEFRAIDIDELQLTRSLLLAAVLQANSLHSIYRKGFVPLDSQIQADIVQKYVSLFAKLKYRERVAV